jgi:hypothetical protein
MAATAASALFDGLVVSVGCICTEKKEKEKERRGEERKGKECRVQEEGGCSV